MADEQRFQIGQIVRQKFLGVGTVDQVRPGEDGDLFHVQFVSGSAAWVPARDLALASKELLRATGYLREAV